MDMKQFLAEKNWPGKEYHLQLAQYRSKRNLEKDSKLVSDFLLVADWESVREQRKDSGDNERCLIQ